MSLKSPVFTLPFTPAGDATCYLEAYTYTPPIQFGAGPWPAIIGTRAGGYTDGGWREINHSFEVLSDAGYLCMFFDVPLAKDGTPQHFGLPPLGRQTIDGKWAQQTDVYVQAVTYMRGRTDCNGFVGGFGGSGSGAHAAWCGINGTIGTTRLDAAVCLSGNLDAGDRSADVLARLPFITKVALYFRLADTPANLPTFTERSAIANVASTQAPIYFANGQNESMPFTQFTLFKAKCDNAVPPVTNYVSYINLDEGGSRHSFGTFNENELGIKDFLAAAVAAWEGEPPPEPPPPIGLVKGISCLMGGLAPVPPEVRASPSITAISLRLPWHTVQKNPLTFDFSYFTTEMTAALAVNPNLKFLLLVQTGDDNRYRGGFKPTWLYTLLANSPKIAINGIVTAGSPTVTFTANSGISVGDIGKRVYLSSRLPGAWVEHFNPIAAYIGVWTSGTSIGISSSPSANVPLNALVSGTDVMVEVWTPGGVEMNETRIVPGVTYSFVDTKGKTLCQPVLWNDILARRKRLLYTKMGDWLAALPAATRNAVSVVRTSFVNMQGDDWHIPEDDVTLDIPGNPLTQVQRWLHLPTDPDPGAGYTTQKIVDIAATVATNQTFTTGTTQGNLLKCKEAGFSAADIGKVITGAGIGPNDVNTIRAVGINDSVQGAYVSLESTPPTQGAIASFTIPSRKTGLFDVMKAAFGESMFFGHSIAQNGQVLDKTFAQEAGDTDVKNFAARSVNTAIQAAYYPMIVTQKNGIFARTVLQSKASPSGGYGLFKDIGLTGAPLGGQALWRVFNDPLLLMNGGTRLDYDLNPPSGSLTDDQILERSGTHFATYTPAFYEVYSADIKGLPIASQFLRDLWAQLWPGELPLAPVITSPLTSIAEVGAPFSYQITADNGPILSYGASNLPVGLTINTVSGLISGTPATLPLNRIYNVVLTATNTGGTGSAVLVLTVIAQPIPVITSLPQASAQVGNLFLYQITADHNPKSFDATNLPPGLTVNRLGLIAGTPTVLGVTIIGLSATNDSGTGFGGLTLTVITDVPVPEITSPLVVNVDINKPFSYQITANGNPSSMSAAPLPPGLFLADLINGQIIGTPTAAGVTNVVLSATNDSGTGTATMVLTVKALPLPPPEIPPLPLPPALSVTWIDGNFRDNILYEIAALLNIDPSNGISAVRERRWTAAINRHIRYAWRLWEWRELILTEPRAFYPIYSFDVSYKKGAKVYYPGLYAINNGKLVVNGAGYYKATKDGPPGADIFELFTLTDRERFVPLLQSCRWRIGDVLGVYGQDPRPANYLCPQLSSWELTGGGIRVQGGDQVAWIRHRVTPFRYTADRWNETTLYPAGSLVLWDVYGEVHRAIITISGISPKDTTRWAYVPFPVYFAGFATYMAAADDSDDAATAARFRAIANEFLVREMDEQGPQTPVESYDYRRQGHGSRLLGVSGFRWSAYPPYTEFGAKPNLIEISDVCLNEWGSVIPKT